MVGDRCGTILFTRQSSRNAPMPILDHFHPPLSIRRNSDSFHTTWTVCLGDALTALLPESYLVEVQTQVGAAGEIDVATFDEAQPAKSGPSDSGVAVVP